jgi:SAM-dependent methyltransferase
VIGGLNSLLARWGKVIIPREQLYEWQINPITGPSYNPIGLPANVREYLVPDNPRLVDLKRRYAKCDPKVTTPLQWTDGYVRTQDIAHFRGDNAYVFQVRGEDHTIAGNYNVVGHLLATYYVKSIDCYNLLDTLAEDNAFGNFVFEIADHVISRDLLDSIIEIDFLDRHLGLMSRQNLTILDVGAGYGRLAYRLSAAVPGLSEYICVDAVPYSTFISEFYLTYRKAVEKTRVVALDEIDWVLPDKDIDIAVNICSFPECRLEAIEWWVSRLARWNIKHFLVSCINERLENMWGEEFSSIVEGHGYRPLIREPKYRDKFVQKYAIAPIYYSLFELC